MIRFSNCSKEKWSRLCWVSLRQWSNINARRALSCKESRRWRTARGTGHLQQRSQKIQAQLRTSWSHQKARFKMMEVWKDSFWGSRRLTESKTRRSQFSWNTPGRDASNPESQLGTMTHALNPNTREAEAGGWLQTWGQPELEWNSCLKQWEIEQNLKKKARQ